MKNVLATFALLTLTSFAAAQTTGVPGVNDLRVNLMGSGTTSCNTIPYLGVGPLPVVFDVTCAPMTPVIFLISPSCTAPGIPFLPSAPAACGGPLAGTPPTNLWLSLNFPILLTVGASSGTIGQARTFLQLPGPMPPGMSAAVQALMLNTCSPWGFIFSQAHTFSWN